MVFVLAVLAANLAAAALLAFSGGGAVLQVAADGKAVIQRKSFFGESTETFRWDEVRHVRMTGAIGTATSASGRRGAAGENLELELANGKKIAVYSHKIAWPIGNLDRKLLYANIGKPLQGEFRSVSLGGASWFISFILIAISGVAVLMKIVVPITPGMPAAPLAAARWSNLWRFGALVTLSVLLWAAVLWGLAFFLIGEMPPL